MSDVFGEIPIPEPVPADCERAEGSGVRCCKDCHVQIDRAQYDYTLIHADRAFTETWGGTSMTLCCAKARVARARARMRPVTPTPPTPTTPPPPRGGIR